VASGIAVSSAVTHAFQVSEGHGEDADAFGFAIDALDSTKGAGVSSGTGVIYAGVDSNGFTVNTTTDSSTEVAGMSLVSAGRDTHQVGVRASMDRQNTADGTGGISVTAKHSGIQGQISGLTISISDSEGNVKKSANAALDAFKTQVYAKNESDANEMSFHVGANANQAIAVSLDDMRSEALGLKGSDGSKVSVATQDKANAAVSVFDNAIQKVLDQQATIGAIEARLEYTSQNLTTSSENVQAAESTIRDADMAKEMTNYTKNNVLLQAAQSMLAQANQNSSAVLSLLQ
jgi:flagellin